MRNCTNLRSHVLTVFNENIHERKQHYETELQQLLGSGGTPPYMVSILSFALILVKIKALPPQNSEFRYSSIMIKYIIIIIIIMITTLIVIKTFTSSAATLTISLTSFWEILEDKPFFLQKFLMEGTKNSLTFGYFF